MDSDQNKDLKDKLERLRAEGVLAVSCPTCGSEASFHRAFAWLTGEDAARARTDPEILGIPESGGIIVELFPEVFLWTDPERAEATGNTGNRVGVLRCRGCKHHAKHRITWPDDLYFRIRVSDTELVAYTREHAEDNLVMLEQLRSVPKILRPFLQDEVATRMPVEFLKDEKLAPAITALRRLLDLPPGVA